MPRINCTSGNVEIRNEKKRSSLMITINYFYGFGFVFFWPLKRIMCVVKKDVFARLIG